MNALRIAGLFAISLAITFCGSGDKSGSEEQPEKPLFTLNIDTLAGKITPEIMLQNAQGQSYAIYLPPEYNGEKKFPVIYIFDPHARGVLPLKKYEPLAKDFGYILIASNNSKNGLPAEATIQIGNSMINETMQKFRIDDRQVYIMGFSGGARVGGMITVNDRRISGLIGCGAGLPPFDHNALPHFHYLGIVGNGDFNYLEMKNQDEVLENALLKNHLLVFDGGHNWPPPKVMFQTFAWLRLNAMKNKIIPADEVFAGAVRDTFDKQLNEALQNNNCLKAARILQKADAFLSGIIKIRKFRNKLKQIQNTPEYKEQLTLSEQYKSREAIMQQEYLENLNSKDIAWWKQEIARMNGVIKSGENIYNRLLHSRLLSFLGMMGYMTSSNAVNTNQLKIADKFLKIYALAAPENPDQNYLRACYYMKINQPESALTELELAVKKGYTDREKLLNEPLFRNIAESHKFQEITEKIQ